MVSQHDVKCLYKSFEVVCSLYHKQIGCLAADKTLSAEAERYYKKKKHDTKKYFCSYVSPIPRTGITIC